MMGSADNLSNPSFEDLLLAMAPLDVVFSSFVEGCRAKNDSRNNDSDQKSSFQGSWYSVEAQDQYAQLLGSNWNTFGPSERYLRKLVRYYVKRVEETPGAHLESDDLLSVVLKTSLKSDSLPNAEESCYLTFSVPDSNSNELLRIRVFPHHNDVALRLWEASILWLRGNWQDHGPTVSNTFSQNYYLLICLGGRLSSRILSRQPNLC
jgi:hypothetical protein